MPATVLDRPINAPNDLAKWEFSSNVRGLLLAFDHSRNAAESFAKVISDFMMASNKGTTIERGRQPPGQEHSLQSRGRDLEAEMNSFDGRREPWWNACTPRWLVDPRTPGTFVMRRIGPLLAALLIALAPMLATAAELVVRGSDGDTITVMVDRVPHRARLNAIDALKLGQPFSAQSKRAQSDLVFGQTVSVGLLGNLESGRVLARADHSAASGTVGQRDAAVALAEHVVERSPQFELPVVSGHEVGPDVRLRRGARLQEARGVTDLRIFQV